jgi:phenylalanyl-tRNA synthetase beta subunit
VENIITEISENLQSEYTELELELKRILFEFTDSSISVKFIKPFAGYEFGGIKIPSVTENSRLDIPYFIAEILLMENFIEDFRNDFPLSLQDLTAAVRKEVRHGEVQQLHPYFYSLFSEQVMKSNINDSHYDEIELKRQKDRINQLITERLSKIIKLSDSNNIDHQKLNLTAFEAVLLKRINSWVVNWKSLINQEDKGG